MFAAGCLYALLTAQSIQDQYLPQDWEGRDVQVSGVIADLPERRADNIRFLFIPDAMQLSGAGNDHNEAGVSGGKLRLSWYQEVLPELHAGERWQLTVRLKRPNGFMNPGGFDYEQWLFAQRVIATGYVRDQAQNQRLQPASGWQVNAIRERIRDAIASSLGGQDSTGLMSGLAVADRSAMTATQWDILRATGTSHLLAISGLHIGMVAGFGFLPVALVWWLFPALYLRLPVRIAGGLLGGVLACAYALLAGFTLPTQRSLVMVVVLLAGLVLRRRIPFPDSYFLALFAVVLLDPLASLSAGFWLSFLSVAWLFLLLGRQRQSGRWAMFSLQLGLSLGMIPLTAALFGAVSLTAPLANLLAIPWVSVLVVPLVLLGVLLSPLSMLLAGWIWNLAGTLLDLLFVVLGWLADWQWSMLYLPELPWYWLPVSLAGFGLLLLPKALPGRWLGLVFMLPVLVWRPAAIGAGEFRLTVLDVGQGLASVVQTATYTLVFDTGPRSSPEFDTGELVLLPWLRSQGIARLDTLLISHADNDHSGGAESVLAAMPVGELLTSNPPLFPDRQPILCQAGMHWQRDGIEFRVLHPSADFRHDKRNNNACVLRVSNGFHAALLTADIERPAEQWLVGSADELQADVLLAPHHGSKTSSSIGFLDAVRPAFAVVSSGYLNRFHHPHPKVVERYRQQGVNLLNTVDTGSLRLDFPADSGAVQAQGWRMQQRRFWNR